jgi:hypothetical protein
MHSRNSANKDFGESARTGAAAEQQSAAAGFHLDQHSFEAAFAAFDPDQTHSLSVTEYMGFTVFLQGTAQIFGAFDPQRQGRITLDYNQFVYAVSSCR